MWTVMMQEEQKLWTCLASHVLVFVLRIICLWELMFQGEYRENGSRGDWAHRSLKLNLGPADRHIHKRTNACSCNLLILRWLVLRHYHSASWLIHLCLGELSSPKVTFLGISDKVNSRPIDKVATQNSRGALSQQRGLAGMGFWSLEDTFHGLTLAQGAGGDRSQWAFL